MRKQLLALILVIFMWLLPQHAYAGFKIQQPAALHAVRLTGAIDTALKSNKGTAQAKWGKQNGGKHKRHPSKDGWEGTTALVFGIVGCVLFSPLGIPAIVFGALGMGKGHKHKGLAIAGLVLGILATLYAILVLIIFASLGGII